MKNKYNRWVLLGLFACLLAMFAAVSCAGSPPASDGSPGEGTGTAGGTSTVTPGSADGGPGAPPDQAALNALDAAAARAAAARKLAMDFGAPSLLPEEWDSADSLYTQAEQQKKSSTRQETQESIDRYNRAADAFEALNSKAIAQYYEDKLKELNEAREAAVMAGAQELFPDLISDGDSAAEEAQKKYEAKDYYAANDAAETALASYRKALESAAGEKHAAASAARQKAMDAKANVAVRQEFASADTMYSQANSAYEKGDFNEAAKSYIECVPIFEAAALEALEKQRLAEEAMKRASEKMAESDETARSAESVLEGGLE